MKNITIVTREDWSKLSDYADIASREIKKELPSDWGITAEEITSYVLGVIAHLIDTYKHGATSVTSYCYQYAKQYAQRDLMREYIRLKKQLDIYDLLDSEDEDGNTRHYYGKADVQALTVDGRNAAATKMDVAELLDRATPDDRAIMLDIMAGKSYDEIAAEQKINKREITRRMRKYAEVKA